MRERVQLLLLPSSVSFGAIDDGSPLENAARPSAHADRRIEGIAGRQLRFVLRRQAMSPLRIDCMS
jgi:hypothetical protein